MFGLVTRVIVAISVLLYGPELGCPSRSPAVSTWPTTTYPRNDTCPYILPIQLNSICPASSIFDFVLLQQYGVTEPQHLRDDVCPFLWPIQRVPIVPAVTTLNDVAAALGHRGLKSCEAESGVVEVEMEKEGVAVRVFVRAHDDKTQSHAGPSFSSYDFWVQKSTLVFLAIITFQFLLNVRFYRLSSNIASKDTLINNLKNELAQKVSECGDLVISKYEALKALNAEKDFTELLYKTDRTSMQNIINNHWDELTTLQGTVQTLINLVLGLRNSLRTERRTNARMVEEKRRADKRHQATFNEMFDSHLENQSLQDRIRQLEFEISGLLGEDSGEYEQGHAPTYATGWDSEETSMTTDSSDDSSDCDALVLSSPGSGSERSWLRPAWAEASIKFRGVKRRPGLPPQMREPQSTS